MKNKINLSGFTNLPQIQEVEKAYQEGVYSDSPANKKLGRVGMTYKQYEASKSGKTESKEEKGKELKSDDKDLKEYTAKIKATWTDANGKKGGLETNMKSPGKNIEDAKKKIMDYYKTYNPNTKIEITDIKENIPAKKEMQELTFAEKSEKSKKNAEELLKKVTGKDLILNKTLENLDGYWTNQSTQKVQDLVAKYWGEIKDNPKFINISENLQNELTKVAKGAGLAKSQIEGTIRTNLNLAKEKFITPTFLKILKEATQDNDHNGAYVAVAKKFKQEDDMKALIDIHKRSKKGMSDADYQKQRNIYQKLMIHIKDNYGEEIYKKIYNQL